METRANYVVVGIFTLVAIVAAFAFVYWTSAIGDRGETATLRVRIPGSASGLGRGSAVLFNGVKVGDVRRVYIDVLNPTVAIADAESRPPHADHQIDAGRYRHRRPDGPVQHRPQGRGFEGAQPARRGGAGWNVSRKSVANPSAVTNLLQTAQNIFNRADNVLSQLEGFTQDVRGPLTQTAENAKKFSDALAANADGIDKFLSSVSKLSEELAGVSGKLDGTLKAAEESAEIRRPPEDRDHRRQCRDLHQQPEGAKCAVRRNRRRRRQGSRVDQRLRTESRADAVQGGRRA